MADSLAETSEAPAPSTPTTEPEPSSSATSFDMDAAVTRLGSSLFPAKETKSAMASVPPEPELDLSTPDPVTPPVELTPVPKTWPKDMHEHWGTASKPVQDYLVKREQQMMDGIEQYKQSATYGKSLYDVIAPHQQALAQQGMDAPRAVAWLLEANHRLTQGSQADRLAAYQQLGKNLGFDAIAPTTPQVPLDPQVQSLKDQMSQMQQTVTAQQHAVLQAETAKVNKELELFAADPLHPYFNEVIPDMEILLRSGLSLTDAYNKAVWANEVTRAKELAKTQTADLAKAKENARLHALPKKQAAAVNVKSRESSRAPTEPAGTMRDTMKTTLAKIHARAS